jgi:sodium-dependent dicarboxylate transporter 2/3/5
MQRRLYVRIVAVLALTILTLMLPTPEGLSPEGKRAIAAFVFTSSIFTLQPVSLPFAGLIVFVSMVVLGVADADQAFQALSRPIVILILGSLFIAEALRKHGITRRFALGSIVASGGDVNRLLLGLMAIASLLSMFMENTATAAVLIPVAMTITNRIDDKEKASEVTLLLVLGIAYAASLGGMVTITGSASNAVASGFLAEIREWTFMDWVKYGLPSFAVIFPITWWLLPKLVKVSLSRIDIAIAQDEVKSIGPIRPVEWEIMGVLVLTIVLWIAGPYVEILFSLPKTVMSPSVVSMLAVTYLSMRDIIVWDDVKDVSWGMLFIIGAGLTLGEVMKLSGATEWLTDPIALLITHPPFIVSLLIIVFSSALLTNIINNATVAAVFTPMMIGLARQDPTLNILQLVIPLTLATTFGYALPSASGRMALISATGIVERGDMIRFGIILTIVSALALTALFYVMTLFGWI